MRTFLGAFDIRLRRFLLLLQIEMVEPIELFIELDSHFFELVLQHLALGLQILNFLAELDDVLLKVDLAIREELAPNLLHFLRVGLLLNEVQCLLELI